MVGNIIFAIFLCFSFYPKQIDTINIIGLVDKDGRIVVKYAYDAFGNILQISGDEFIGKANPFRYKGYYYDDETGLYYNVTRYYNPQLGRFLNADDVSYLDPSSINGLNLFAYCLNNPIMMIDSNGMAPEWLKDVGRFLGGLAITAVTTAVTVATFPLLLFPGAATIPQFGMTMMIYGGTLMA